MRSGTRIILFFVVAAVIPGEHLVAAKEPPRPTNAATKKPADDPVVEAKYQALVDKLPPEEQAWERTLQANLGSFYLPIHKRERVKGTPNAWAYVKDDPKLSRVLLIGDSVSRGYTMAVRKALAGKANVHRAPENCGGTANGLKKLDVWLGDGKWDLIHFNFGIHDHATPLAEYEDRLEKIVARLQKTGAKLVWASTTPIPKDEAKKQTPESIVERNAVALRVMQRHGVAVDDLFAFITPHLATAQNPHDVHFNAKGYDLLGGQVAQSILANLNTCQHAATDEQLCSKAEDAWRASWERFYDDRTHLFYDRVCSYDPKKRLAFLPTPEEIGRQYPNRNGWGTGMEDCAISGGVMLSMVCDRFEATRDAALRQPAGKVFAGLVLLGTFSPSEGFVIRGVCPADQRSHYCESSRDQYTWYAYGLWRYYRSPLSSPVEKATMRKIIAAICARLERNVVAKSDWHIGREDGTFDGLVDKMWNVLAHEAARLPMIYAIGADLTGDNRWRDLARRFSPEAATQSRGESTKIAYALLQEQVSLEPLYELEESPELKRQWLEAMRLVSARASVFLGNCRGYRPQDMEKVDLDWRSWPTRTQLGYRLPVAPDIVVKEDRTVRQPAEAALTLLLCPSAAMPPDQLALLKQTIAQVDYSKAVMYGLYYTQAVYWRAVRLGLLKLPAGSRG
jgi:lysophospholipase L1-like esterase